MLNYCTHAIEALEKKDHSGMPLSTRIVLTEVKRLLDCSVKFHLPDSGRIIEHAKALGMLEPELIRMPFKDVALEYTWSSFDLMSSDEVAITKRIALCLDRNGDEDDYFTKIARQFPLFKKEGGLIIIPIYDFSTSFPENNETWFPGSFGAILHRCHYEGRADMSYFDEFPDAPMNEKCVTQNFGVFPGIMEHAVKTIGLKETVRVAARDTSDEVLAVSQLIAALSCSNVSLADIPAPAKLNKKRLANTKSPKPLFYSYKEIVITPHQPSIKGAGVGTHKSPVTHLRRGHIRRYENKRVWINATMVNPSATELHKQSYKVNGKDTL